MHYSVILSESDATKAFTQLEQGMHELLDDYLHYASELLSKMKHNFEMSSNSAEGINHYAVISGLNCRKLKETASWDTRVHSGE